METKFVLKSILFKDHCYNNYLYLLFYYFIIFSKRSRMYNKYEEYSAA